MGDCKSPTIVVSWLGIKVLLGAAISAVLRLLIELGASVGLAIRGIYYVFRQ